MPGASPGPDHSSKFNHRLDTTCHVSAACSCAIVSTALLLGQYRMLSTNSPECSNYCCRRCYRQIRRCSYAVKWQMNLASSLASYCDHYIPVNRFSGCCTVVKRHCGRCTLVMCSAATSPAMSCRHSGNCGLPASTQRRFISSMLGLFTLQQAKKDIKTLSGCSDCD
jgi:hypothetical protein